MNGRPVTGPLHLHYAPTYSSWLNQVECWFSKLSRSALRGANFTSPQQLREAIDHFVKVYNQDAAPFEWTKATAVSMARLHAQYPRCNHQDQELEQRR